MRIQKKKINRCCVKFFITDDRGGVIAEAYLNILRNDKHKDPFCIINEISIHEAAKKNGMSKEFLAAIKDFVIESGCYRLTTISEVYKIGVNRELLKFGFGKHAIEFRIDLG